MHHRERPLAVLPVVLACFLLLPFAAHADNIVGKGVAPPKHKWTKFVQVESQPEPVPAEWVSTPEGQFAHSIKIPNPVPKDSGYRWWWSAKKYFLHLCETEAGEFVFKTADNVGGFLFMRPPKPPTDFDLKDRYKLEAPAFEARYQLRDPVIDRRGTQFVSPPHHNYLYYEEPYQDTAKNPIQYLVASNYDDRPPRLTSIKESTSISSRYAVTWRGLRRPNDREKDIGGAEIIVWDLGTRDVMGVMRTFGRTGRTSDTPEGIWWLNAAICPQFYKGYARPELQQMYGFVSKVLKPALAPPMK